MSPGSYVQVILPLPGDLPADGVRFDGQTLYVSSGNRVFKSSSKPLAELQEVPSQQPDGGAPERPRHRGQERAAEQGEPPEPLEQHDALDFLRSHFLKEPIGIVDRAVRVAPPVIAKAVDLLSVPSLAARGSKLSLALSAKRQQRCSAGVM